MKLPEHIEQDIVDYLRREFGEVGTGAIGIADLTPLGIRRVAGVALHVWQFPTSTGPMWATVEPDGDSYCIGLSMPADAPEETRPVLRVHCGLATRETPLAELDAGLYGAEAELAPPGRSPVMLSVEVMTQGRPAVVLAILDGDDSLLDLRAGLPFTLVWADCHIDVREG